jgi:F-type H+-transporting ATPase subunit f
MNVGFSRQSSGGGASLAPLVNFYSKLPKGSAPRALGGLKARFFNGENASGSPIVFTILSIFGLGYFIDYQSALPPPIVSYFH